MPTTPSKWSRRDKIVFALLVLIVIEAGVVSGLILISHGPLAGLSLFIAALGLVVSLLSRKVKPEAMYFTGLGLGIVGLFLTFLALNS